MHPEPSQDWLFRHLQCLSKRRASDQPLHNDPGRLWQVLALVPLVPFSVDFTVLYSMLCLYGTSLR